MVREQVRESVFDGIKIVKVFLNAYSLFISRYRLSMNGDARKNAYKRMHTLFLRNRNK